MRDCPASVPASQAEHTRASYEAEIARLNKIINALIGRAERAATAEHSDFGLFQAAILLEAEVSERTRELEAALHENERITRQMQQLQEQLREQAIRDPLTGLYNRRFLDGALEKLLVEAGAGSTTVSVIMVDLDRFKAVNDTYGHPVGDSVLRAFADVLRRHVRSHDICCRFGGEEFLLVLPGMVVDAARARAEAIRTSLNWGPLRLDTMSLQVTASFGVATFPRHARSPDALIEAADRALYRAKQEGRNRVVCEDG